MNRSKEFYLLVLGSLLIEIRNLEDSNLEQAKSLAYIFHNIPGVLLYDFDEQKGEKAWKVIQGRAEYFKLTALIEVLEKMAFEILGEE